MVGFSGGIWLMWKHNIVVDIVYTHPQFFLAQVKISTSQSWFFSIVYGSHNFNLRKDLWDILSVEFLNIVGPWLTTRDINSVI